MKQKKDEEEIVDKHLEQEIDNEEKVQDSVNKQNYLMFQKVSRLFQYKVFGIIFLVVALLMILGFFLMKYLNFYFNFGPMSAADAENYKDANWLVPFDKWNWGFYHDFQNEIMTSNGKTVVIVSDLTWANTTMAVTRSAFIVNSIANGNLYIGLPLTFNIGIILLILHFTMAKRQVKSMASAWLNAHDEGEEIEISPEEIEPKKEKPKKSATKKDKPKKKKSTKDKPKKVDKNKNKKTKK